ncbi:hypothetical protein CC2G_012230 [Coprinopsis cinerea AmutBmut pab1-1]|nr:hypothetical protein CC2G_012230 [Coprinopsis cinerea AmutBmut pab1-1]
MEYPFSFPFIYIDSQQAPHKLSPRKGAGASESNFKFRETRDYASSLVYAAIRLDGGGARVTAHDRASRNRIDPSSPPSRCSPAVSNAPVRRLPFPHNPRTLFKPPRRGSEELITIASEMKKPTGINEHLQVPQ